MKKTQLATLVIGLSMVILPALALAEDSSSTRPLIQNPIRAQIEQKREEQKQLIEQRREEQKQLIEQKREEQKQIMEQRREDRKELRADIFKLRQENIVRQLTRALDNLKQVRTRIDARITKSEQAGRNMTDAKALLVTADAKIAAAVSAINSVATFVPPVATSTATSTASSTPGNGEMADLQKPRIIADGAIGAIKDAKDALNDVVVSIAHSMGLKLGNDGKNATSTATSTATTTP